MLILPAPLQRGAGLFSGVLAQLVERLNGIEEVRSSSLLGSTILAAAVTFGSAAVFFGGRS